MFFTAPTDAGRAGLGVPELFRVFFVVCKLVFVNGFLCWVPNPAQNRKQHEAVEGEA